jgi:hypothetical protein
MTPPSMCPEVSFNTVNGTAPCANATATITVTEPAPPNAGTDASVAICANGAASEPLRNSRRNTCGWRNVERWIDQAGCMTPP